MPLFYLDIETTGVDPARSKILTIQFQEVGFGGRAKGPLTVLKAWESSEADILQRFKEHTPSLFDPDDPWAFFPTGFNLGFEYRFLQTRMQRNRIELPPGLAWDWHLNKPSLDLHPVAILMNGGRYKGSSLENFSRKPTSGHSVITSLQNEDWPAVEAYIEHETEAFFELLEILQTAMPRLWQEKVKRLVQGARATA